MNTGVYEKGRRMSDFRVFPMVGEEFLELLRLTGLRGFSSNRKEYTTHISLSCIWLFLADETVLKIVSEMHDLEGWDEVGSLVIDLVRPIDYIPPIIELPTEWQYIVSIEKLVVSKNDYFKAESGLKIINGEGKVIIICSAAAPYELALMAPFVKDKFTPEYDVSEYKSCRFLRK